MKKNLFLFAFLTIALFACNEPTAETEDSTAEVEVIQPKEGWATYTEADYSLHYPEEGWVVDNSGAMGANVIFLKNMDGNFRDNVNIYIEDLAGKNIDMDTYVNVSSSQLQNMVTNYSNITSERATVNGEECQIMVYTGTQGVNDLQWKQCYFLKNDKAYVFTYTAKQSTYEENLSYADEMMNSFRFN